MAGVGWAIRDTRIDKNSRNEFRGVFSKVVETLRSRLQDRSIGRFFAGRKAKGYQGRCFMVRRLNGPVPLVEGQLVFDFYKAEVGRLVKKRKEKIKQRKRKQLSKRLLSWMDATVTDIPDDILHQLDALIEERKREIQSRWSAEDEGERRGLDIRNLNKLSSHDGRFFRSEVNAVTDFEFDDDE